MDVFKTHGAFSWSELTTTDPRRGRRVLRQRCSAGSVEAMDMGTGAYHVLKVGEAARRRHHGAAARGAADAAAWGCYVTVDDVDATAAQAKALGGKVMVPADGRARRRPHGGDRTTRRARVISVHTAYHAGAGVGGAGRGADNPRLVTPPAPRAGAPHRAARRNPVPPITYPESLPVSARREEIARAMPRHQVVIVCGETGSGKTTQLPKIALELGRGRAPAAAG